MSDVADVGKEQILIRKLPTGTKKALAARAKRNGRSVEAEARALIISVLESERITIVDLVRSDADPSIEFEPERLGLSARGADL